MARRSLMRRLLGAVGRPLAHTNGTGRGPAVLTIEFVNSNTETNRLFMKLIEENTANRLCEDGEAVLIQSVR